MKETSDILASRRIIPAVVINDLKTVKPLGDAFVAGGLPVMEVTLRTPDSLAALERIIDRRDILAGAGTVTTLSQFDAVWRMGARFVVTPGLDESILRHGRRRDILVIPGAVTPTEIMRAQNLGLSLVKFFPAHIYGGLAGIDALSGPFPQMRFLPTGGINLENLPGFLQHPSVFGCGGTWMARQEWIKEGAWDKVQAACATTAEMARNTPRG